MNYVWIGAIWGILAPMLQLSESPRQPTLIEIAEARGILRTTVGSDGPALYTFSRGGVRRETLRLTAGSTFETGDITAGSVRCISLVAAMPFNLGDGAVLTISVPRSERPQELFQLMLDPAHVRAHRAWIPIRFEIPDGLDTYRLRFEVAAGFRGDYTADWIGIAAGNQSECLLAEGNR